LHRSLACLLVARRAIQTRLGKDVDVRVTSLHLGLGRIHGPLATIGRWNGIESNQRLELVEIPLAIHLRSSPAALAGGTSDEAYHFRSRHLRVAAVDGSS